MEWGQEVSVSVRNAVLRNLTKEALHVKWKNARNVARK